MLRISFGLLAVVFAVEGYYYNEYFPEEKSFRSKKGDDYSAFVAQELNRPGIWKRLKQRSENMLQAYGQRRDYTPYRRTTYQNFERNIPQSNVYNQESDWQTYTRHSYEKGGQQSKTSPQTVPDSKEDEYRGQSEIYVYPRETVESSSRFVDARPDYTDRTAEKIRKKAWKKAWRRKWGKKWSSSEYRQSTRKNDGSYQGCVDTGEYCTFWKSIGCCEEELGRKYCSKTCGFCSPQQTICPSSYKFGCCRNGEEANDPDKSNCPANCEDLSGACKNRAVYEECDLHHKNSLFTRNLCPVTCGACDDYSN